MFRYPFAKNRENYRKLNYISKDYKTTVRVEKTKHWTSVIFPKSFFKLAFKVNQENTGVIERLTTGKLKRVFLSCHCHEIYKVEEVGLKYYNYT